MCEDWGFNSLVEFGLDEELLGRKVELGSKRSLALVWEDGLVMVDG